MIVTTKANRVVDSTRPPRLITGGMTFSVAFTRKNASDFLLFASVGLGLAEPYILPLINPHWLPRLPRSLHIVEGHNIAPKVSGILICGAEVTYDVSLCSGGERRPFFIFVWKPFRIWLIF